MKTCLQQLGRPIRREQHEQPCSQSHFQTLFPARSGTIKEMNIGALSTVVLVLSAGTAVAAPGDAARAILENRCLNCHGKAQTSGLDLRHIDSIAKGGKRGPAI